MNATWSVLCVTDVLSDDYFVSDIGAPWSMNESNEFLMSYMLCLGVR